MIDRLNAALEGRYTIERQIGEGGMATVFLALDLRHDRPVALKVLRPELAAVIGADRFLSEIRVTAALRHPNILPLFDSGKADSFLFYVMPYVEGESLRDRLDREQQLRVDDAVRIAVSVANALDHAHRKGVVHRDVKPANIMLQDGEPVVADFGIALAVDAGQARLTETGLSVGTPYYMSPEQATGERPATPASDVYSLACVLYEMLAGQPANHGATAQAVLARIISGATEPVRHHRPTTPPNVEAALRKGLERLTPDRFESAERFAAALVDPGFRYGDDPTEAAHAPASRRLRLVTAGALVVAAIALVVAAVAITRSEGEVAPRVLAQELTLGVGGPRLPARDAEISSDGRTVVYRVTDRRGVQSLYARGVTESAARPLSSTEGVRYHAISPSSDQVAFTSVGLGRLSIVPLDGGAARVVAENAQSVPVWGEGYLYFLDDALTVSRVPIDGGAVERVIPPADDGLVRAPTDMLPGGDVLLFNEFQRGEPSGSVRALSIETGEMTTLAAGFGGVVRDGLLFYTAESRDQVIGVEFDSRTLSVSGPEVPVLSDIASGGAFAGTTMNLSRSGDLIHAPSGSFVESAVRPVWVDRSGGVTTIANDWSFSPSIAITGIDLSHDGYRLAVASGVENRTELYIRDLRGGPVQRLAFEGPVNTRPFWSPDDREVYYFQDPSGSYLEGSMMARRADGSGSARQVLAGVGIGGGAWSRDGEWLIYRVGVPARPSRDIFALRSGSSEPIELVATDAIEQAPSLSPNGRWLLYQSNRTGQHEVYVRPFPEVDAGLQQISLDGGTEPRWAHSGDEIFYRDSEGRMVSAGVDSDASELRVSERDVLFDASAFWSDPASQHYDVAPDDQRFLMLQREAAVNRLIVTWNGLQQAKEMIEAESRSAR